MDSHTLDFIKRRIIEGVNIPNTPAWVYELPPEVLLQLVKKAGSK